MFLFFYYRFRKLLQFRCELSTLFKHFGHFDHKTICMNIMYVVQYLKCLPAVFVFCLSFIRAYCLWHKKLFSLPNNIFSSKQHETMFISDSSVHFNWRRFTNCTNTFMCLTGWNVNTYYSFYWYLLVSDFTGVILL